MDPVDYQPNEPEGRESYSSASVRARAPSEAPVQGSVRPAEQGQSAFMQQMAQFFQQVAQAAPQRSIIEKLTKYRPEDFYGKKDEDAISAENWLERTERIVEQMHCTPEQKLECAVSLLQGDAYQWWESVSRLVSPEEKTWDFFLKEFRKKYVGRIYINNLKREFTNLRQRQMSVTEYEREFTRLSKYAPEMVADEVDRCRRFEDGLNDNLRLQVAALEIEDFSKLVSAVLNVERVENDRQARRNRRQQRKDVEQFDFATPTSKKARGSLNEQKPSAPRPGQESGVSSVRPAVTGASTPGSSTRESPPSECAHCGRTHRGECWKLTGACFGCGSKEHYLKDCPKRQTSSAPQTRKSTPTYRRGQKSGQDNEVDGHLNTASETVNKQEISAPSDEEDQDASG